MINDNIKKLRKLNLTREQVSEKLNVSRQTVSKWERGEIIPDIYNCTIVIYILAAAVFNFKMRKDKK
jgi:transcriptional regulator with XRE-family HTH domain